MPSNHGLSLVEVLVVFLLIAVVSGVAFPAWQTQIIAKEVETASR